MLLAALHALIALWCAIFHRLNPDHRCDAVISHLHTGAADALDSADPHAQRLSQGLRSESTLAYVQVRMRLPLALLWTANRHLVQTRSGLTRRHAHAPTRTGHAVRWLDGTTFRLALTTELVTAYGPVRKQHGDS